MHTGVSPRKKERLKRKVRWRNRGGMRKEEGRRKKRRSVAIPGKQQHHSGEEAVTLIAMVKRQRRGFVR
ncbi:hypothetical protein BHE74_00022196 [Ensete ventricosum]|uniref:Uncharacterized protein n=1 Tax=Ensete ventricosum TaxID=4639 RepID=A0A445MMV5_ENSVE|nr:hypothetical protein BHE74_00022196 [Ensete ventricosum]RZR75563.1 hypothetical protein BHM03_00062086 [Ensete ventricosum]